MKTTARPLLMFYAAFFTCFSVFADPPSASPLRDVQGAVEKWIGEVTGAGKVYKTTLRASDGISPLQAKPINDRLFAFKDGDVYIGIGFSTPPKMDSTLGELRGSLEHIALDHVPVPGIKTAGWETRLQTPVSSFKKGVTIESWKDGVLCVRVQTQFFAAYGRRTDILMPEDVGMPEGTYFQIRKPITADLLIEGRLFPTRVNSPKK